MRILVVDDEEALADAVARGLRREGYAVDVAYGGGEALEKVSLVPYDLVCLDLDDARPRRPGGLRRIRAGEVAEEQPRLLMLTARDVARGSGGGPRHWAPTTTS